jgi:prepilin-type N-terminal cleavage/methylation domain-containing protein/prepilin-type processing-associated H-X9-DG protein
MGRRRRRRSNGTAAGEDPDGFTLIELLVVISIIVLLMAVLLPTLGRVRKQARAVACQANLRQWGIVFSMYMNDHNEQLDWKTWTLAPWWSWSRWYASDSNDLLLCSAARRYEVNKSDPRWEEGVSLGYGKGSKFTSWKVTDPAAGGTIYGSYGFNALGLQVIRSDAPASHEGAMPQTRPDVFRMAGSRTPVLLDAVWCWAAADPLVSPPAYDGDLSNRTPMESVCINRHDGAVNNLFLDWSARRVGLKELWTLKWYVNCDTVVSPWTRAGGVQPEDWPEWMRRFREY